MSVRLEYMGFVNTGASREYALRTQDGTGEAKTFILVIAHEEFASGHARYQDGPDICYQRLLRELALPEPPAARIALSREDLFHYHHAHVPKTGRQRAAAIVSGLPESGVVPGSPQ